jgi:hypothetical protein
LSPPCHRPASEVGTVSGALTCGVRRAEISWRCLAYNPLRESPLEDMDTKLADVMSMREGTKDAASLQRYGWRSA